MDERVPGEIRPLLEEYLERVSGGLPGFLQGFYLVGSTALGGFNPQQSDIDFAAVTARPAGKEETQALAKIHGELARRYRRWKFEGSYFRTEDLGRFEVEVEPYPGIHDGKLRLGHFELNAVTWWILKHRGIALLGPEPAGLAFEVDWNGLIERMAENLNTYWKSWTTHPMRRLALLTDWGVQWTVLGVLRQDYSFCEGEITTKEKAGAYGLAHLGEQWHGLIREALALRQGKGRTGYRGRIGRAGEAAALVEEVIRRQQSVVSRQQ